MLNSPAESVFHAALVVFSAIQIHETRTALVRRQNCDGSVDYVVCSTLCYSYWLTTHMCLSQVMWRRRHLVQESGAFSHRGPGYHRCIIAYHDFLRAGTLLRIRVSNYNRTWEV